MKEMNVSVVEQPGKISEGKAQEICRLLLGIYRSNPEFAAEVDLLAEEIRKKREETGT